MAKDAMPALYAFKWPLRLRGPGPLSLSSSVSSTVISDPIITAQGPLANASGPEAPCLMEIALRRYLLGNLPQRLLQSLQGLVVRPLDRLGGGLIELG